MKEPKLYGGILVRVLSNDNQFIEYLVRPEQTDVVSRNIDGKEVRVKALMFKLDSKPTLLEWK